jgi:hypothetical protein
LPAVLLPAVVGSAIAVEGLAPGAPAPVACEIRVSESGGGIRLEPVATATTVLSGEYAFTVSKKSGGGTSVSAQSGDFEAGPGEPASLGVAVFDRDGTIDAELTVRWAGGAVSCERRYPDRI